VQITIKTRLPLKADHVAWLETVTCTQLEPCMMHKYLGAAVVWPYETPAELGIKLEDDTDRTQRSRDFITRLLVWWHVALSNTHGLPQAARARRRRSLALALVTRLGHAPKFKALF
jgi:hypothetical protein